MTKFYKRIGTNRNNDTGIWVKYDDDKFYLSVATSDMVGVDEINDYCEDWELISNELGLKLIDEENKKYLFPEWFNLLTAMTVLLDYQEVYEKHGFLPDKTKALEIRKNLTDTYKNHREWLIEYVFIVEPMYHVTDKGDFFVDELQWMIDNLSNDEENNN